MTSADSEPLTQPNTISNHRLTNHRHLTKQSSQDDEAAKARVTALFNKYTDEEDPFVITMEGIATLCDDLSLDPTPDIRCLVLFCRLGAVAKPGQISQAEWNAGMKTLKCDSIEDLKKLLPGMDPGFMEHDEFKSFYKYVFLFSREGTHKTIEKDMTVALLQMVLSERNNRHLTPFAEFLETLGEDNVRITLDQWVSFLEFSVKIGEDCKGYDDDDNCAWPVLIDEYVDWKNKKK
jgi:hypothetical protein